MAEPFDRDGEAGQSPSPDWDGSGEGLGEDDLDIDTLASVWKDDLLLDAIAGASTASDRLDVPFDTSADRRLVEALLSWRREIESDPVVPAAPDPVPGAEMDSAAGGARRRGFRVPLVSVLAAAVVIIFTAVAAYGAAPDEALFTVTEVLYSQHAESVRAAHDVGVAQTRPERQWRQDVRTMPTPRSTRRLASCHECRAGTVRPSSRTGSAIWRGSSTPTPAPRL